MESKEIARGINVRAGDRAVEHVAGTVLQARPPEHGRDPDLLVQLLEGAIAFRSHPHDFVNQLPGPRYVGLEDIRGHEHQLTLDEPGVRGEPGVPLVAPVIGLLKQLEVVRGEIESLQDCVGAG